MGATLEGMARLPAAGEGGRAGEKRVAGFARGNRCVYEMRFSL